MEKARHQPTHGGYKDLVGGAREGRNVGFGADTLVGWNSWRLKPTLSEPQSSICKMGHLAEVSWMPKPRVLHPQAALRVCLFPSLSSE